MGTWERGTAHNDPEQASRSVDRVVELQGSGWFRLRGGRQGIGCRLLIMSTASGCIEFAGCVAGSRTQCQ